MVEGMDDEAVSYVNSKTGIGSPRIVKDVNCLMYICNTDMEKRN